MVATYGGNHLVIKTLNAKAGLNNITFKELEEWGAAVKSSYEHSNLNCRINSVDSAMASVVEHLQKEVIQLKQDTASIKNSVGEIVQILRRMELNQVQPVPRSSIRSSPGSERSKA